MKMSIRVALACALLCLSPGPVVVQALGYEPYPWPNACIPSCEKPMRREFAEPLEFGARIEPEKRAYTPSKSKPKPKVYAKKKPPVIVARKPRPRSPVIVVAPVPRPYIYGPIRPHTPPVIYVPTNEPSRELTQMEDMFVRLIFVLAIGAFVLAAVYMLRRRRS
jgi:hypothetical protein